MVLKLFSIFGSFASVLGLIFSINGTKSFNILQWFILLAGIILFVIATILILKEKPRTFKKESQISDYLHKWISHEGKVAIFSRDMSWAGDTDTKDLLLAKARHHELCICLPVMIPLVNELKVAGAEVFTYQELGYIPQSRFTIIHQGRMDAQVGVGRKIGRKFIVEEFSIGGHPVFSIANDLLEMIIRFNQWKSQG